MTKTETVTVKETVNFDKTTESLTTVLEGFGINIRIKNEEENKVDLFMGRKKYDVTFGQNFIRIAKDDKKIQIAYKSNKNTKENLLKRIEEIR